MFRSAEQLCNGTSRCGAPIDNAGNAEILVHENIADVEIRMRKRKAGITREEARHHLAQELTRNALSEPVLAALEFVVDRREVVPLVHSSMIAGPARILRMDRYRRG